MIYGFEFSERDLDDFVSALMRADKIKYISHMGDDLMVANISRGSKKFWHEIFIPSRDKKAIRDSAKDGFFIFDAPVVLISMENRPSHNGQELFLARSLRYWFEICQHPFIAAMSITSENATSVNSVVEIVEGLFPVSWEIMEEFYGRR